jgi:hypothetical protein
MLSVKECLDGNLVGNVSVCGYFYYPCFSDAFISDSKNYLNGNPVIFLNKNLTEKIILQDSVFGVLVGGQYAYYALFAEISGTINKASDGVFFFSDAEKILLRDVERGGELIVCP